MPTAVSLQLATEPISLLAQQPNPSYPTAIRQFRGIANSGKPFRLGQRLMVLDLSTLKLKDKTAVLLQHDPMCRAGVATLAVTGLVVIFNR